METIAVLYKTQGESPHPSGVDSKYCTSFLTVPQDREVLLVDLLQLWIKQGGINRVYFSFYAVDENGNKVPLQSPLSVLPIVAQTVHLLLVPAAAPPVTPPDQCGEWLDYSRWQRGGEAREERRPPEREKEAERPPPYKEEHSRRSQEDVFAPPAGSKPPMAEQPRSEPAAPRGPSREHSLKQLFSSSTKPPHMDETVQALAGAATVASEYTGHAARSLFNFAAKSVKTVATSVASMTGHIQVGNHRVVVVREIAQGGFGIVMLVRDVNDNKLYAMKQMFCQSREQADEAHLELRTLQKFSDDPHIITLVDYASLPASKGQHAQVLLLFPFYSAGTAWDMVAQAVEAAEGGDGEGLAARTGQHHWPFPERAAVATLLGTARALRAMHDEGVAHRDLKPHNILISETFSPVIMDLGSVGPARVEIKNRMQALKAEDEASCKCSAPYRAPELMQISNECVIDGKIDVWSLGCTAYCLAFGNSPFETPKEGVLKLAILNARYSVPAKNRNMSGFVYSEGYIELVHSMLRLNPAERPDMDDIVQQCKALLDTLPV